MGKSHERGRGEIHLWDEANTWGGSQQVKGGSISSTSTNFHSSVVRSRGSDMESSPLNPSSQEDEVIEVYVHSWDRKELYIGSFQNGPYSSVISWTALILAEKIIIFLIINKVTGLKIVKLGAATVFPELPSAKFWARGRACCLRRTKQLLS